MKIVGIMLLVLAGFLYWDSYEKKINREKKETRALFFFLSHLRREISAFQKPLSEIIKNYDNHDVQINGFLEDAKANGIPNAMANAEETLALFPEGYQALTALSEKLGRGYPDAELRLLDYYIALFSEWADRLDEEAPKKKKICRALLLTGGLSALLFVL